MIKLIKPKGHKRRMSMVPTFDKYNPGQSTYIVMEVCICNNASFRKSLLDLMNKHFSLESKENFVIE